MLETDLRIRFAKDTEQTGQTLGIESRENDEQANPSSGTILQLATGPIAKRYNFEMLGAFHRVRHVIERQLRILSPLHVCAETNEEFHEPIPGLFFLHCVARRNLDE